MNETQDGWVWVNKIQGCRPNGTCRVLAMFLLHVLATGNDGVVRSKKVDVLVHAIDSP
jgi:hypothetical protein